MASVQTHLGFARNRNEEKYKQWATKNPDVIATFLWFARQRMSQGRKFGIKALFERVRWDEPISTKRTDEWRLNNCYTPYVARDLIHLEPRLVKYIKTRRVAGER